LVSNLYIQEKIKKWKRKKKFYSRSYSKTNPQPPTPNLSLNMLYEKRKREKRHRYGLEFGREWWRYAYLIIQGSRFKVQGLFLTSIYKNK